MKTRRLVAALASTLAIAAACSPFGSATDAADASTADASTAEASIADASIADASFGDGGRACASISDEFERDASDIVMPPWAELDVSPDGSSARIVTDEATSRIFQLQANGGGHAYLRANLDPPPTAFACSFAFRPTSSFDTGNASTPGDGPGLDIFLISLIHSDGTKTILRFSYKTGTIELRRDESDADDDCTTAGGQCALGDIAEPATGMAPNQWTNMTLSADVQTGAVMLHAETDGTSATVRQNFPAIRAATAVQLYFGVINFGSGGQLGSYDHFHCDLSC